MTGRERTPTASQGSRPIGVVADYVLKLARKSAGVTQEQLADSFGVDLSTVQGWEVGRRPLSATGAGELLTLGQHLARMGASPSVLFHLHEGVHADLILSAGVRHQGKTVNLASHPLASFVLRRSTANLVTWPITGILPQHLADSGGKSLGPGPVARFPSLDIEMQRRLFDHLMIIADRARQAGEKLLLRQAVYLLGFDQHASSAGWIRAFYGRAEPHGADPGRDLEGHLSARSAAVSLAAAGDPELLHKFADSLADQNAELVNLNYWAHWIGETELEQVSDSFMLGDRRSEWHGARLLNHLTHRLDGEAVHRPLILRSLHALISCKPELLSGTATDVRASLTARLVELESSSQLTASERDEAIGLLYALRLARTR